MQILSVFSLIIFVIDSHIAITFFSLMCYYFHLKINKFNKKLDHLLNYGLLSTFKISKLMKSFTFEHNQICIQISNYNQFWRKLYFKFIFTVIPMNLCFVYQLLFEEIELFIQIFIASTATLGLSVIFLFQFFIASISSKMHKSVKNLSRLQLTIDGWPSRMRTKIKLLICFERLSSNRKIGFSIGSLTVMTFPLFYKVIQTIFLN